jgi:hypothetical protein
MSTKTVVEALQAMEFTHGLELDELEKLATLATPVTFQEGKTIFQQERVAEVGVWGNFGEDLRSVHPAG